jgi:hypothetical protein
MSVKKPNWDIDWRNDYIREGARFAIKDKEGNLQGRLEFLSKPEIDFGDNNGYVTVKIRAGCIGCDGKPVTNVKLEKEFELYEVNEDRYDLIMALDSFRFVLWSLIAEIDSDSYLMNEFLYHLESSRNTLFFHYVLLERKMARLYPQYIVRIRRIGESLDEAFEKMYNFFYGKESMEKSTEQFNNTLKQLNELIDRHFKD